jgi:hypothetical protein
MLIGAILSLQIAAAPLVQGRPAAAFDLPRAAVDAEIDGQLADSVWQSAARLTGFFQYEPSDGQPSAQPTEVRVYYTPRALYFGIVAHRRTGSNLNATVSNRDNILNDDRVLIYLDTFNDRRRAFVFGVNPYGVQLDGVRSEGSGTAGRMFGGGDDWSPDFHYESSGVVTDSNYIVEVKIPFKSLRFPPTKVQEWGLNISRVTPSTNTIDTWVDTRRGNASFLAQSGVMRGIGDVERGVVTEWQPFFTTALNGSRDNLTGNFERDGAKADAGINLRLGFPAISLDATVNPDFSQVESDVGQVTANERFALFIPEKRPFFLEGIELFSTPNQLVYTRRVVSPVGGAKLTGKVGRLGIAHLSAVDDNEAGRALFNITRLRTDLAGSSIAGITLTDRRLDDHSNTVIAADTRIVFGRMYYFEAQAGQSWNRNPLATNPADADQSSPMFHVVLDRTGPLWGFHYQATGFGEDFTSEAGFVPRNDNIDLRAFNRLAFYGRSPDDFVQSVWLFGGPTRLWHYSDFGQTAPLEGEDELRTMINLRGGWRVNGNVSRNFVTFEPEQYTGYQAPTPGGMILPYLPHGRLDNLYNGTMTLGTPIRRTFDASVTYTWGSVAVFAEGSKGSTNRVDATIGYRPSPGLRVEALAAFSRLTRAFDGSEYSRTFIPRAKLEFQPTRSLLFRVVSELRDERTDALRANGTNDILTVNGQLSAPQHSRRLQTDWLISYEPSPGTVAFLGYGNTLRLPDEEGLSSARRQADGFFLKVAYQFRN